MDSILKLRSSWKVFLSPRRADKNEWKNVVDFINRFYHKKLTVDAFVDFL